MNGHRVGVTLGGAMAAALMGLATPAIAQPRCGHGRGGPGSATEDASLAALDARTQAAVEEALADERRTGAAYEAVIRAHGAVRPFSNAVHAETRHAGFLADRLTARGLAVPSPAAAAAPAAPGTLKDACAAAVASERANVALYDRLLAAGPLPDDVKSAFEHNRWASLEHHLPAFQRCAGESGVAAVTAPGGRGTEPGGRHRGACGRGRGAASAGAGE